MKTLTAYDVIDAAVKKDLSQVENIINTWQMRRWSPTIVQRNRIDFVCKYALLCLERAYPGKVWPYLTQQESDAIDRATSGLLE